MCLPGRLKFILLATLERHMKLSLKPRTFALAMIFAPWAFSAEKVYMPFFELINIHEDYQFSLARLFKSYVDEAGRYELVLPERPDSVVRQPGQDLIRHAARELKCAYFLVGDVNRLGETVFLNLALYNTGDGSRIWGDKLKASTPEDFDPIFQKLAWALGSGEKAGAHGDIYSVTANESRELRQIQVKNSIGVAIGGVFFTPGLLFGKSWEDPFVGGVGVVWNYDSRNILFEFDGMMHVAGEKSSMGSISISAFKPFTSGRLTPFAGGGLGIGIVGGEYQDRDTEGTGLLVQGGGGVVFNRTATVQLRLQARYVLGLFSMGAPRDEYPQALVVRMELAFGR